MHAGGITINNAPDGVVPAVLEFPLLTAVPE